MVTGLYFGRVAQRWIVSVDFPVHRGGRVPYFVTMSFIPTVLSEILAAQELPGGQIAAVTDESNKVIARSRDIEQRLGKEAPAWLAEAVAGRETGVLSGTGSMGGDYVTAFQRLDNAPWLVNVGAPVAGLRAEAGWPLPLLGIVALATLVATAGLVWALSRRLTGPVAQLANSAGDLLEGRPLPPLAVPELERLRRALAAAGEAVRRSAAAQERAKAADELAAVNAVLEQRLRELKRSERRQKLLVDELNHRVKNTLATVQGLARQTLGGPGVDAASRAAFEERLHALATVHDLLSREGWESMDLARLVGEIVAPHCAGAAADRIKAEGPPVRLLPNEALALGMILHELCTNAVKHGALSRAAGLVAVTWQPTGSAKRLRLEWRETGGPAPAPGTGGFGARLVERVVRGNLRGRLEQEWRPEGLVWRLEAPLAGPGEAA
jgi:two-component sensor histidine kinase